MTRIGLISDTHGWLDDSVAMHFKDCDEIWHAGDFGNIGIAEGLKPLCKTGIVRGVYGNIDGADVRSEFGEKLFFTCEKVKVYMQHIGGYPGRYSKGVKDAILENESMLFISGHSHILKIIFDDKLNCLHMNPGAAGKQGWHKVKTLIRFTVDGSDLKECEVVEMA